MSYVGTGTQTALHQMLADAAFIIFGGVLKYKMHCLPILGADCVFIAKCLRYLMEQLEFGFL